MSYSIYDLDEGLRKIAEGQKCTKNMFDLMQKLGFAVEWDDEEGVRAEIALYLQRLVFKK